MYTLDKDTFPDLNQVHDLKTAIASGAHCDFLEAYRETISGNSLTVIWDCAEDQIQSIETTTKYH